MKLSLVFIFMLSFSSMAQEKLPCGTKPTQKQIDRINQRMRERPSSRVLAAAASNVAISAHILRRSDGTGGLGEADFNDAISTLNGFYANANLKFFILGGIHYIDDNRYFDFDSDDESALGGSNDVENTINIYFANSVVSGEDPLCGYAYFSGGPNRIVMDNGCTVNGSTLAHEVGHFFDLYHTHGKTNTGTTDELVDGSNCATAGDNICDTPADPQLTSVVDADCNYTGTAVDANDDEFAPDTGNIMSYSRKSCRMHFSAGQYSNIANTYASERNYLVSKSLAANFDADVTKICTGSTIIYKDKSISPGTWAWEFPGGSPATSSLQNPEVTYAVAGTYGVTLTISNDADETDVKTFTEYIVVEDPSIDKLDRLSAGFETSESVLYAIENEDNDDTYEVSSTTSSSGSKSMLMDFLNYDRIGEEDYLIFDDIDLSGDNLYRLTFDRAYAYFDEDYRDSLAIVIAESCSNEWQVFRAWSAEDLATAKPHTLSFVPENFEWKNDQMLVEFDESWESARLAFKTINGFGNNLYLDQIDIELVDTDLVIQDIVISCTSGEADGMVEVLATGSGDLTYSLDNESYQEQHTISSLEEGDYHLYVKQNGSLVAIEKFTMASAASLDVTISADENGNLLAQSDATSFEWYFEGEKVADATGSTLTLLGGGVYFVVATNEAGCSAKSKELVILRAEERISQLLLYPNPVASEVYIKGLEIGPSIYQIVDLTGKSMQSGILISPDHLKIRTEKLKSGIYLLNIKNEKGSIQRKFQKM